MAKKIVKKTAAKKPAAKKLTSLAKGAPKKSAAKKSAVKKAAASKTSKVALKTKAAEKEFNFRQANMIANSEKKTPSKRPLKSSSKKQTNGLLDSIIDGMQEKKAKNITVLNLSNIENRIADYFVVCDADSNTHVNAIADSVEDVVVKKTGEKPYHSEGQQNGEWILIDYINIVVHVFLRETREYYNIEGLWGDAEIQTID
jgi:ribosome-associated protein